MVPYQPCGRQCHLNWVNTAAYDSMHSSFSRGLGGGCCVQRLGFRSAKGFSYQLAVKWRLVCLNSPALWFLILLPGLQNSKTNLTHFYQHLATLTYFFFVHSFPLFHIRPLSVCFWLWLLLTKFKSSSFCDFRLSQSWCETVTLRFLKSLSGKGRGWRLLWILKDTHSLSQFYTLFYRLSHSPQFNALTEHFPGFHAWNRQHHYPGLQDLEVEQSEMERLWG